MQLNQQILSNIIIYMKYARYLPELKRRESWSEICDRYENMMVDKYPQQADETREAMQWVREKKVLPSMRAMQFAGTAIARNNS